LYILGKPQQLQGREKIKQRNETNKYLPSPADL